MNHRVTAELQMELLSDGIFGSGYSIPGGEDIAVCRDSAGYPYIRGSTLKGLLRESLTNLLAWTGGTRQQLEALLGKEGWNEGADTQIRLTDLTLDKPPLDPEDCFSLRAFTALEEGTAKDKTLRMAACIRHGSRFTGKLECSAGDEALLRQALAGIKWAGTLRHRGFGRVRLTTGPFCPMEKVDTAVEPAACLFYRLYTESRVLLTDYAHSDSNDQRTRGFLPGSAVRGMVIGALARQDPAWFEAHQTELLREQTRFLDALPSREGLVPLPSVKGFYEDKEETVFTSVVVEGSFTPGLKRAQTGEFCALQGQQMHCWRARVGGTVRIRRAGADTSESQIFQTHCLEPGQSFEGYILLERPELAQAIARVLTGHVWLGADRFGGFGRCRVQVCRGMAHPAWMERYGCQSQQDVGRQIYLLAMSPVAMLDSDGEVCGLAEEELARALGIDSVRVVRCSTSVETYGGYNRTWASRIPTAPMYERGSLFLLECSQTPALEALHRVEREGVGIRRAEGFGQLLFLRRGLLEQITGKELEQPAPALPDRQASEQRRERIRWIVKHAEEVRKMHLSASQLGSVQSQCERAIAQGGNVTELETFLQRNLKERGARQAAKFKPVADLIHETLSGNTDPRAQLRLLCDLLDYQRKEQVGATV